MGHLKLGLMRAVQFLLSLLVLAVAVPPSFGQTTPPPALEHLLPQYGFADADVGCLLFDPANGRILEAHRPDEPRIPASTTKVTTLIAALQILGGTTVSQLHCSPQVRSSQALCTAASICAEVATRRSPPMICQSSSLRCDEPVSPESDVRLTDPSPEARAWTERAKALERALVTSWIAQY